MGQITLKQVTKSFGDVEVIPPLDLTIEDGEFASLSVLPAAASQRFCG
jgi:ABC-type sugar transport system ATPase subunit